MSMVTITKREHELFKRSCFYEGKLNDMDCFLRVLRDYSFDVLNREEIKQNSLESIYTMVDHLKNIAEIALECKRIK